MGAPEWIARFQSLLAGATRVQSDLLQAALGLPGFQFDETMSGTVSFSDGVFPEGTRSIVLHLHAQAGRLGQYLMDGRTELTGTANIEGLVDGAPVTGSLWIWPHRRIVRYDLSFPVLEHRVRLAGQKDVRLLDFRHTMSTLPAEVLDENDVEAGRATVAFDWADLPAFLRSFRPVPLSTDAPGFA